MKSKLMMLILAGGLAFSANTPSATATTPRHPLPPTIKGGSVTVSKATVSRKAAQAKKAIPSKDTGKCTVALDRAVC